MKLSVNVSSVLGVLGALWFVLGVVMLVPALVGVLYGETAAAWSFFLNSGIGCGVGGLAWWRFRPKEELGVREGVAVVTLSWLSLSLLGAVPFVTAGVLANYTDAFFETISGFTTTGATILGGETTPQIEAVPNAFLFWRSLTHWLGGMGIIVLTLAVLPLLGVGGMQLFKAEAPGPSADKLTPRVKETARQLWMIYVGLTVALTLLLLPAMSLFDAINHALSTMASGGFSTENGSVGQYGSAYIEWVITVFMMLAGINFALFYRLLHQQAGFAVRDRELWLYGAILFGATLLITLGTYAPLAGPDGSLTYASFSEALRHAAFQTAAIITTTGFGTADYEIWPSMAMGVIFLLFFTGGMA
ncbi:MAG: potassium transporter TrkG, partial [Bacteroidota bacterium]